MSKPSITKERLRRAEETGRHFRERRLAAARNDALILAAADRLWDSLEAQEQDVKGSPKDDSY